MNKKLLLSLLLWPCFMFAQSTDFKCYKWEGVSVDGHFIFGIAKSKTEAQIVIDDFNNRNSKTDYRLSYFNIRRSSIKNKFYFDTFYNEHPRKYRVLKTIDIASLRIFEIGNFERAVIYLNKNSNKNKLESQKYLQKLLKECEIYRLTKIKV